MTSIKECEVCGESYQLIQDFQDNDSLRAEFNALTQKVFGFDFEGWYQAGYWTQRYRPFTLMQKGKIVANVSANDLSFLIQGEEKKIIQIGTVMTDPAYRKKGLSRFLMETVLETYENSTDFQYLFAGDEVLDYYPKFGFEKAEEFQCSKRVKKAGPRPEIRKLDLENAEDRACLLRLGRGAVPVSTVAMIDNFELNMFYCGFFLKDKLFYLPSLDLVAVASVEKDELMIYDVFCGSSFDLDQVIQALMMQEEMTIALGFTPLDDSGYASKPYKEEDRTFFVRGGEIGRTMLPLLSQA